MHPPKTNALSNTVALEAYLLDRGVRPEVALGFCMEIGLVAEKVVNGSVCNLFDQSQLETGPMTPRVGLHGIDLKAASNAPTCHETLVECLTALTGKPAKVIYVGVRDLCAASREESRRQQLLLFRMTREMPVRVALNLGAGVKRSRGPESDDSAYLLRKEIKRAIGFRKLENMLDDPFGNAFSKTIRDNIVDLLYGYCVAVIANDSRAPYFGRLCEVSRVTRLLGMIKGEENTWASFVNHASGKTIL